ncbi:hypothetical protein M441DRAFT_440454 [Trichoderma asperellum CBS 433.97]|uniref:Uncharacterized protein n=1 Tax=Trichoderma asperellum (strain ATCC 204424 / CBS 433.97 / NBRC 101777) TaxID=1042311 RepID=A0A2T3Z430_TRIA4|nr:hypothetical protein M441DRAFT_440454 [Trichoderma asperellum CBS 433.97]PTB39576.1 hypothetical protein M441DRAFT_440454 [Trichoderma asperellum CBS 433.97]
MLSSRGKDALSGDDRFLVSQLAMPLQIWTLFVSYFFSCKCRHAHYSPLGTGTANRRCSLRQLSRSRRPTYKYFVVYQLNALPRELQMNACM